MRRVTFRQLRVFTEVARQLSFSRAAESLHLTPPAVTMQVKELESHIGLPLFERQGRQISLTMAGEYFLVYAKRMLSTMKDAENVMARFKRVETGVLTIGMISTAGYFMPALLAQFQREHPGVDVRLDIAKDLDTLVQRMQANEVDLAVTGRPPKEYALRSEPFAGHPMVFVCPPGHPLLGVGHPPLQALVHYPLIAREPGSEVRYVLDKYLREKRLAPIMRTWNIVHEASKVLSPAAEAFRYYLIEHAETWLKQRDGLLLDAPANT
ncbi:MAG: LysR family transcriptional regulator [Burkholderiales bacterium]|nr:LysR family transcriptional regulator [Burkholderiales bacterium]